MKFTSIYAVGFALVAALGISSAANAQLFVEPGITLEQGNARFNEGSGIIGFSGDLKGLGVSLKVGGHINDIFFLSVDAMYSQPDFSSTYYSTKTRSMLAGLTAGLQTPYEGVRVWASYLPLGNFDQDSSQGLQMKFSEPQIWKIGAGLRVSTVSLNLEYFTGRYNMSSVQNNGSTFAQFNHADAKRETWMLGVSFPYAL